MTPDFSPLDLSVVLLAYRRTALLREQVHRLEAQSFRGSFELILWNNGAPFPPALEAAVRTELGNRPFTIVQSSTNYVGRARFAVAEIARGRLLMLCDDDIVPRAGYLQGFVERFESYGAPVVLCGSGTVFEVSEATPEGSLIGRPLAPFHDETTVHFAHANSLLTSTDVFRRAARVPLPEPDYYWIDDLWLSYVWSTEIGVPLVKIKADHLYDEHPSARDWRIALCKNPLVHEQQRRFLSRLLASGAPWPIQRDGSPH